MPVRLFPQQAESSGTNMSSTGLDRYGSDSPLKQRKLLTTKTPDSKDTYFGTINLGHEPSKVVFLFPHQDELLTQLEKKCSDVGFSSVRVKTVDECLSQRTSHEVVVVDARQKDSLDPETFVRNFSPTLTDVVTTIAIVTNMSAPIISRLVGVGYSRIITEDEAQLRLPIELQLLENNEGRLKRKIQFASAMLMAIDFCRDAVEISSDVNGEVLFVNKAYESLTGFSLEEVVGHQASEVYACSETSSTISKESVGRSRGSSFRKGDKAWEGEDQLKHKSGSSLRTHTKFIPVSNALLKVTHNVIISNALHPEDASDLLRSPFNKLLALNGSPLPTESPSIDGKRSVGSFSWSGVHHEDTPLWKVFKILNDTSDHPETTESIRHALNIALSILRATPELYITPETTDKTDNALIGLTINPRRYSMTPMGPIAMNTKSQSIIHHKPPAKVKAALEKVMSWDFDIINLEHLCQHQYVVVVALLLTMLCCCCYCCVFSYVS
jgi:PAS domain S-box-containing protein